VGLPVTLSHAVELPAIAFIKTRVISYQINRGDAFGPQVFNGHVEELSGDAFAPVFFIRIDGADVGA
jgi:hypothetical protein